MTQKETELSWEVVVNEQRTSKQLSEIERF